MKNLYEAVHVYTTHIPDKWQEQQANAKYGEKKIVDSIW